MLRVASLADLQKLKERSTVRTMTNGRRHAREPKGMPAKPKKGSQGEFEFWEMLRAEGMPLPRREFRFHETRQWRFDFAWPDRMLALEVEGGIYSKGRHARGQGYQEDLDKYNAAVVLGWGVLRYSTEDVVCGKAIAAIRGVFQGDIGAHHGRDS